MVNMLGYHRFCHPRDAFPRLLVPVFTGTAPAPSAPFGPGVRSRVAGTDRRVDGPDHPARTPPLMFRHCPAAG
jgi:hypothetical protein